MFDEKRITKSNAIVGFFTVMRGLFMGRQVGRWWHIQQADSLMRRWEFK